MKVKIHTAPNNRMVLAICDSDILGKSYEDGEFCLDIQPDFFGGEEMDEDKAAKLAKKAYMVSLAGEQSIAFAKKKKIIDVDKIKKIKGIPYAVLVNVDD